MVSKSNFYYYKRVFCSYGSLKKKNEKIRGQKSKFFNTKLHIF